MGYFAYYDWNATTSRQPYLNNRIIRFPQGRVLGGGTIINGMVWTRGAQADYDAWEQLGNPGWSWADLLPYFKKVQNKKTTRPVSDADVVCRARPIPPTSTAPGSCTSSPTPPPTGRRAPCRWPTQHSSTTRPVSCGCGCSPPSFFFPGERH